MVIKKHTCSLTAAFLILLGGVVFTLHIKPPSTGFVIEVVDGDTIRLKSGALIRYLGLNSPETKSRDSGSWVNKESYWGRKAYLINKELVLNKQIRIEYDKKKKDKYKRLLGYVFAGDVFVNKNIIQEGLAVIDVRSPNFKYVDLLADSFKNALDKKKGIWSNTGFIDLEKASLFEGDVVAVKGKILDVYEGKEVYIFLMPLGFKIVLFKNNSLLFKSMNFMELKNKQVKVYGMIKKYKKHFEMVIHHPYQLEAVE